MSKLKSVSIIALVSMSLMASACTKKAEGQVVAIVNGEEITLTELNGEIAALNLPATTDVESIRSRVLGRMVDRRLLVQAAKEAGLDRDPEYLNQQRRADEQLLVSLYGRKAMDTVQVPEGPAIDQFMAAHPDMFASRVRYRLEQLQFDPPADMSSLKQLESEHTLQEVAARLTAMGISFQHGTGVLDSATIAPEALERIRGLPAGEPFVVPANGKMVVNVITGTEEVILPADQARPMAVQAMRNERLNKIGEDRLNEARVKAEIEFQEGFEPPEDGAAAASPGTALNAAQPVLP